MVTFGYNSLFLLHCPGGQVFQIYLACLTIGSRAQTSPIILRWWTLSPSAEDRKISSENNLLFNGGGVSIIVGVQGGVHKVLCQFWTRRISVTPPDVAHVVLYTIPGFFLIRNRIAAAAAIRMRTID